MPVKRQTFRAKIFNVGINPGVDVPARVSRALCRRGYVPVVGRLNHTIIRATLVPLGGGRHRLYLNTQMRQAAGVGAGDRVTITLKLDTKPRIVRMPKELAAALAKNEMARRKFKRMTPSHRKEWITYLRWLKSAEARERNVRKIIAKLSAAANNPTGIERMIFHVEEVKNKGGSPRETRPTG